MKALQRNILACYYRANPYYLEDGMTWYWRAHNSATGLAHEYDISTDSACGVVAALSPGMLWEYNFQHAEILISEFKAGTPRRNMSHVGVYGRKNVDKSIAILKGQSPLEVLGGPKVRNFYANLLAPSDKQAVTIDRHAKCLAYGLKSTQNSVVRPSEYEELADSYRSVAGPLQLIPCQLQAVCWLTWRGLNGSLDQLELGITV